jgi:hypothetical protein
MLRKESRKVNAEFDAGLAHQVFSLACRLEDLRGELITSPYDLYSVETLRDVHGLRQGRGVPADVFVFGKGESPDRSCTKVGGLPYWPSSLPWPRTPNGMPYHFLAQFNFADSRDLYSDLPGDVLLLLTADPEAWSWEPDAIRFEWQWLGENSLIAPDDFAESSPARKTAAFFGAIWRTADYPDSYEKAVSLESEGVDAPFLLSVLNGTKIGGSPSFIQDEESPGGQFLCQFGSIQAAAKVPYPWVNQREPLGLKFDETGIYGDANSVVFGDMGNAYIFIDGDGTLRYVFQCF